MRARTVLFVGALLLCAARLSAQQGTSAIGGKVVDQGGGVLPGVTVVVTNEDTGLNREVITGADGSYFVGQMPPGKYRTAAKLEGFKALDRRGIVLDVGRTTDLNLTLEVGAMQETVTVTSDSPLIDVTSAQVGGHISSTEINELPQGNRSYMALVGNVPGASFVPTGGFLNDTMTANGQPAAANNVSIDGANNVDDLRGTNVGGQARTANETLQEVQVMTNQFDAEFGRSSGAVINAVTKSGSNQMSGSAFDFFTGKNVTAKDFFAAANGQEKPDVAKTEWGGTFGGPIFRNKMFFFTSLERVTQKRNISESFPSQPALNYSTVDSVGAWNTFVRVDHQVTSKHTWAFRWQREVAPQFPTEPIPQPLLSDGDETDADVTFVGNLTSVVSNNTVNTFRASRTTEMNVHATPLLRNLKPEYNTCGPCSKQMIQDQALIAPMLDYQSFDIQSGATMNMVFDTAWAFEDTFSWFTSGPKKGKHDIKMGVKYTNVWISRDENASANGTYRFNSDLAFNAADPRTYPERFSIRVPGQQFFEMTQDVWEVYAQDKWQVKNITFSLGLRYDLEVIPIPEIDNPYFANPNDYPVDTNNLSPRLGVIWNPDGRARTVIRGGYGIFYDKTILGTVDDFYLNRKYSESFVADFPQNAVDGGPANGRFPTDPTLRGGVFTEVTPEVRAYVNSVYPAGSVARNTALVTWDDPAREQPYFHQYSAGMSHQLFSGVSVSADFVSMRGHDMFLAPNLNLGTRLTTARNGQVVFTDPFGVLNPSLKPGEPGYVSQIVWRTTQFGYSDYDAFNLAVEKRFSQGWSVRGAYSLGHSRGVTAGQGDAPQFQVGNNLNLDKWYAPAAIDRKHNLVISGRLEIPKTKGLNLSGTLRMLSGTPFTIQNQNIDADQNTIFFDPLPAGTYSTTATYGMRDVQSTGERNDVYGPGFVQLDMRLGYRLRLGGSRTLDVFGEVFNATNHANFTNPSGDFRNQADFLRYAGLVATTGLPRQFQLGLRFGF